MKTAYDYVTHVYALLVNGLVIKEEKPILLHASIPRVDILFDLAAVPGPFGSQGGSRINRGKMRDHQICGPMYNIFIN